MVAHLSLLLYQHHPITTVFFVLILSSTSYGEDDNKEYTACKKHFSCGVFSDLSYPFWGGDRPEFCGHKGFELKCEKNQFPIIASDQKLEFRLSRLDQPFRLMTLQLENPTDYICPAQTSADSSTPSDIHVFGYHLNLENLNLLYNCTVSCPTQQQNRISNCGGSSFYGSDEFLENSSWLNQAQCSLRIKIPIPAASFDRLTGDRTDLERILGEKFNVSYEYDQDPSICDACMASGGICGTNMTDPSREFLCLCRDHPYSFVCEEKSPNRKRLIIGVSLASGAVLVIIVGGWVMVFKRMKKRKSAMEQFEGLPAVTPTSANFFRATPYIANSMPGLGKSSTYFGVRVFSYNELEEATNCFDSSKQLGDGGFGTVYHGLLRDGREVAVKRLYESNMRRAVQFMNEIKILAQLRHRNLVELHGCTSRHGRELLLVYEYIPNGTVADHLHGRQSNSGLLPWPVRMNIAIETACALAYLHSSDVIHRDVKTDNILLENDFHVKVADFGLSRLFPTDVTHVSTAPQGTPGYVDPEYYQCYHLTNKSDVYSFGVVLIELISGLEAVDITRSVHDINLSTMAVRKIQSQALNELVDPFLGFDKDFVVREMITSVAELAFRCLQYEREMRPTMEEVVEELRGIERENH